MKTLMKRFFVVLVMTAVVVSALPLLAHASDAQTELNYEFEDKHCTVVFENAFPVGQKVLIAEHLLGIADETVKPYGLACKLFGHNYGDDSLVDVITHKVRASAPRCLCERYVVRICDRCDDMETTLKSRTYTDCCPVD